MSKAEILKEIKADIESIHRNLLLLVNDKSTSQNEDVIGEARQKLILWESKHFKKVKKIYGD